MYPQTMNGEKFDDPRTRDEEMLWILGYDIAGCRWVVLVIGVGG